VFGRGGPSGTTKQRQTEFIGGSSRDEPGAAAAARTSVWTTHARLVAGAVHACLALGRRNSSPRRLLAVYQASEARALGSQTAEGNSSTASLKSAAPARRRRGITGFRCKKTPANMRVLRAADGIRTHDLLHGN
jgi:hypothetical protein